MKRYIIVAVLAVSLLFSLVGCAKTEGKLTDKPTDETAAITTTVTTTVTTEEEQSDPTTTADGETMTTTIPTAATTPTDAFDTACAHKNIKEATCLTAAQCQDCKETLGEALGHEYVEKNCTRCGRKTPNYTSRVEVIGVKLDRTEADMLIGETLDLKHTLNPANATDKDVTWKSSNPSIATVTADGKVTAVALGEATITATSVNGKSATCSVYVRELVIEIPQLPKELIYNAQHNDTEIFFLVNDVIVAHTENDNGTIALTLMLEGIVSYARDGHGGYTYPNCGWRLYDVAGSVVAQGTVESGVQSCIGTVLKDMVIGIPSLETGKYRLELYSTNFWKTLNIPNEKT